MVSLDHGALCVQYRGPTAEVRLWWVIVDLSTEETVVLSPRNHQRDRRRSRRGITAWTVIIGLGDLGAYSSQSVVCVDVCTVQLRRWEAVRVQPCWAASANHGGDCL